MPLQHNASIVTCARAETQYVTEWLTYYRSIGFDHVYLYCNDDDPIDLYGEVLTFCEGERPFVTFRHFPYQGQQFYMFLHCLEHHKDESEWIAFLDIDEFLVLPGLDDIQEFLRRVPPSWDAIHFNWSFFGNSFHMERPGGSVLTTYTWREDRVHQSTKTLTRSSRIDLSRITEKLFFWHDWHDALGPGAGSYNVLGAPIRTVMGNDGGLAYVTPPDIQARIRAVGFVNHYALKSARDFQRRFERGVLGDFSGQMIWKNIHDSGRAEEVLRNLNAVEDTYLAGYWRKRLGACQQTRIVPTPHLPNIARGKRANQSSISEWSHGKTTAEDAKGALSGRITGDYQFHTALEAQPWWSVDLVTPHLVAEIWLFNRVSDPRLRKRLGPFRIEYSESGDDWRTIYESDGNMAVGGADGNPLILRLREPIIGRQVRITALSRTFLHLDQVELYGAPCVPLAKPAILSAQVA